MSINKYVATGNLTHDPELRCTATGAAVLTFNIAVNDRRRNPQTEEWENYPNYFNCVMFGKRAESLVKYLSKGSKVAIEGKLRWSQYEKNDERRSSIQVIVEEIDFMSSQGNAAGSDSSSSADAGYEAMGYTDEDIPF